VFRQQVRLPRPGREKEETAHNCLKYLASHGRNVTAFPPEKGVYPFSSGVPFSHETGEGARRSSTCLRLFGYVLEGANLPDERNQGRLITVLEGKKRKCLRGTLTCAQAGGREEWKEHSPIKRRRGGGPFLLSGKGLRQGKNSTYPGEKSVPRRSSAKKKKCTSSLQGEASSGRAKGAGRGENLGKVVNSRGSGERRIWRRGKKERLRFLS